MRKVIIYVLGFVLVCFAIPVIFTNRPETKLATAPPSEENTVQENIILESNEPYVYQKYGEVKLLHSATGEVETLAMDEYLYRSCISRNASKL